MSCDEVWRPVPGYEGYYEVSSLGKIRSLDRIVTLSPNRWGGTSKKRIVGTEIKSFRKNSGYWGVMLRRDGAFRNRLVHAIVCEAFHGPRPDGMDAAHEDGDRDNCAASNVSWKTPAQNAADRTRHGTQVWGANHPNTRISAENVELIKQSAATEEALGERFGISPSHAGNIRRGTRRVRS